MLKLIRVQNIMNKASKITSVVSSLILLLSGLIIFTDNFNVSKTDLLDISNVHLEQRNNVRIANEISSDISKLITQYNDYKSALESQLIGDLDLIKAAENKINNEIRNSSVENESFESQANYLRKDAELLNTSAETAISNYLEKNKIPDTVIKPKDEKEDKTKEKPDEKKPDEKKPDDTIKEKPKENPKNDDPFIVSEDSVILKRPDSLPKEYFWPLTSLHEKILMSSAYMSKTYLFNYFKSKIDEEGNFTSFNKLVKPYHHIGKNALAYAIFSQETNTDVRDKILVSIDRIRNSSSETKFFSSELAYTIIGIIYAKMGLKNKLTSSSPWKPLDYNASKDFNKTESKIINWAIKELLSRQTKSGGFSNYHLESKELYDYDVLTTSLVVYALSQAYQSGFTKNIKDITLINAVTYLLKMQNQQVQKVKCSVLDNSEKPFENVNLRGWGFNYNAKPSVRTTAITVAAIIKVMNILHAASQKNDELIKTYKVAVVDGFSFLDGNFSFSDDFNTIWAVVQACSAAGISRIGKHDIYSEIMSYFSNKTLFTKIKGFSFTNATFAYWSMMWCKQDTGFFKPMKIADYAE